MALSRITSYRQECFSLYNCVCVCVCFSFLLFEGLYTESGEDVRISNRKWHSHKQEMQCLLVYGCLCDCRQALSGSHQVISGLD